MIRYLSIVVLSIIALAFIWDTVRSAPVPPGTAEPPLYFPVTVGTKWVYNEAINGTSQEGYAEVITASEKKNNSYIVTVKSTSVNFVDSDETTISQYIISPDGVFSLAWGLESEKTRVDYDPPSCLLKYPFKVGDKWRDEKDKKEPFRVVKKIETVKVPAGTFEAVRIDVGSNHSLWYAPGKGVVKMHRGDTVNEMKSFTLPK